MALFSRLCARDGQGQATNGRRKQTMNTQNGHADNEKKSGSSGRSSKAASVKEKPHHAARTPQHDPVSGDRYGPIENVSQAPDLQLTELDRIEECEEGQEVVIRARLMGHRNMSAKLAFVNLRQQIHTVQAVVRFEEGKISKEMTTWIEHIPKESLVLCVGRVHKPSTPIRSASISHRELHIEKLYLVSAASDRPFALEDAYRPADAGQDMPHVELSTRLASRAFDLRSPTNQAIFRIQAAICRFFREELDHRGFMEIHSAKLQGGATESGASVFTVDYFGRKAFLAQSPQLLKQASILADFEKVYEVGAVFRSENSNTQRHLTEFTGLDLEMTISKHYQEVRDHVDAVLRHIFAGLQSHYDKEVQLVARQYPAERFVFRSPEEGGTPVFTFKEACDMLKEDGVEWDQYTDLDTPTEKRLGAIVKKKLGVDYYIIDKFPLSARPFYTMPDPQDPKLSNSFDVFMRGQEIVSGGQRIHHATLLKKKMQDAGIAPATLGDYTSSFDYGAPPHGGAGLGLERIVMLFLNLPNIRLASLFPRDPKSLSQPTQEDLAARTLLESKTTRTLFEKVADAPDGGHIFKNTTKETSYGRRA